MKVSSHAYLNLCWLNLYLTEVYTIIISRSVCSNYEDSHQEFASLKSIFKRNSHPYFFVNHCIKKFLNQLFIKRDLNFVVPKRELICVLLYLGKNVFYLRVRLTRIIEGNLPYCQLKVIFRSKGRLNTLFRFKDLLEKKIRPFTSELLNTWESLFLQENALKMWSTLHYLIIYCSVIAR